MPAVALPPASTAPTAANCAPPANTIRDITTGCHNGSPPEVAIAPKDSPTTTSATTTRPLSIAVPRSSVRHVERMTTTVNTDRSFVNPDT